MKLLNPALFNECQPSLCYSRLSQDTKAQGYNNIGLILFFGRVLANAIQSSENGVIIEYN